MVLRSITGIFKTTAKVFLLITIFIGVVYTVIRYVDDIVGPRIQPTDFIYPSYVFLHSIETYWFGIIGVVFLLMIALSVYIAYVKGARFVNNDSYSDSGDRFDFER